MGSINTNPSVPRTSTAQTSAQSQVGAAPPKPEKQPAAAAPADPQTDAKTTQAMKKAGIENKGNMDTSTQYARKALSAKLSAGKVDDKVLDAAARIVQKAGPGDSDQVIAMLDALKKELSPADFDTFVNINSEAIHKQLDPFGMREINGEDGSANTARRDNFDFAIKNWRNMTPGDRKHARESMFRDPRTVQMPGQAEVEGHQRLKDRTKSWGTDGTIYHGDTEAARKRDRELAEEQAKNNRIMGRIEGVENGGPLSLVGRVIGRVMDDIGGAGMMEDGLAAVGGILDSGDAMGVAGAMKKPPADAHNSSSGKPEAVSKGEPPKRSAESEVQPDSPRPPSGGESAKSGTVKTVDTAPPKPKPPANRPDIGADPTVQKPKTNPGSQNTVAAPEGTARDREIVRINTPRGPEDISIGELKRRQEAAHNWRNDEARRLSRETEKDPATFRPPADFWKELNKVAEDKFGLPENWPLI